MNWAAFLAGMATGMAMLAGGAVLFAVWVTRGVVALDVWED